MKLLKEVLYILSLLVLTNTLSWAGEVTIPNEFVSGEKAVAAEVNANFDAVEDAVDDNAADITANADSIVDINEQLNGNNVFIGAYAGDDNASADNVFIGASAGTNNVGSDNVVLGKDALYRNTSGMENVALGAYAGAYNITGQGNIFIGYEAGSNETGSDKLYIDNSGTTTPLIYGDFASDYIIINGNLMAAGTYFRVANNPGTGATPTNYSYQGMTGSLSKRYAFTIYDALWVTNEAWFDDDITCVALTETSDERFKKNIKHIDAPLNKIMQLDGIYYNWKADEFKNMGFNEDRQIGFIAQDVQSVMPELVKRDAKGNLSVNYSKTTALVVEGMKEQQKIIEKQQDEIKKLKDTIIEFENRIKDLERTRK